MNIDDANLINALRSIIAEELLNRIKAIKKSNFDIYDHEDLTLKICS
jgi:hypothetical protein